MARSRIRISRLFRRLYSGFQVFNLLSSAFALISSGPTTLLWEISNVLGVLGGLLDMCFLFLAKPPIALLAFYTALVLLNLLSGLEILVHGGQTGYWGLINMLSVSGCFWGLFSTFSSYRRCRVSKSPLLPR
ncbi:hypothetical protein ZWY2020_014549 [Hordeum vulgare]|nr:hypothetical protein ZWY2020_014549 [Hordeum vulgare]